MNSDLHTNVRKMAHFEESSSDSSIEKAYQTTVKSNISPQKMQLGKRFSKIQLPGQKLKESKLSEQVLDTIFDSKTKSYTPVSYIN